MSAYDQDPRVRRADNFRYDVGSATADQAEWFVRWHRDGEWAAIAYSRPVDISDVHPTADEAIRSLIGNPQ